MTPVARRTARPLRLFLVGESPLGGALATMVAPHGVTVAADAAEAFRRVARDGVVPDVVILDVSTPAAGRDALASLKAHGVLRHVPVLVLIDETATRDDLVSFYRLQASCCLRKPADRASLDTLLRSATRYWLGGQVLLPTLPPNARAG